MLANVTSPGGRSKVKMLFCMESPELLVSAVHQTIACGKANPPASVESYFTRVIRSSSEAPVPGSATWQPDKECRSCNNCQVEFQGNIRSLSTKLSRKGTHTVHFCHYRKLTVDMFAALLAYSWTAEPQTPLPSLWTNLLWRVLITSQYFALD
eukprot:COSAG02_NODE_2105_length_9815_cov_6.857143_2_plen_153_part_00